MSQLLLTGDSATLRLLFAKIWVSECYGDFSPIIPRTSAVVESFAHESIQTRTGRRYCRDIRDGTGDGQPKISLDCDAARGGRNRRVRRSHGSGLGINGNVASWLTPMGDCERDNRVVLPVVRFGNHCVQRAKARYQQRDARMEPDKGIPSR